MRTTKQAYKLAYWSIRSLHAAQREREFYDQWAVNRYYRVWSGTIPEHILDSALTSYQNRRIS